jgi:hypothetical protein
MKETVDMLLQYMLIAQQPMLRIRIRDPSWVMNIPDHISESFETIFGLKILKFFDADPGWKNSDPGSGINIPDPQHCQQE